MKKSRGSEIQAEEETSTLENLLKSGTRRGISGRPEDTKNQMMRNEDQMYFTEPALPKKGKPCEIKAGDQSKLPRFFFCAFLRHPLGQSASAVEAAGKEHLSQALTPPHGDSDVPSFLYKTVTCWPQNALFCPRLFW